jgi:hypothetical protein
MQLQQFTGWLQIKSRKAVVRIVVAVVVIASLTVTVLGILGSNARASNLIAALPDKSAVNTELVPATKRVQPDLTSLAAAVPAMVVYRTPECSCCGGWITHLKAEGFKVKDFSTTDIEAVKQKYDVPDVLTSCHTAIVAGYIIEGHVPASDIKRLLREQPLIAGLSVPQMPIGTPGMEMGNQKDSFSVQSFDHNGKVKVFSDYPST